MVETRRSEPRGDPNVAILLSWFLPGAGHLYLGRTGLGLLLFALLEGLYALGWWLSDGRGFEFLDRELQGPLATLLTPEAGNLGAMLWHLRTSGFGLEEALPFPRWIWVGSMLTGISGLLNVLVCAHAQLEARTGPTAARQGPHPVKVLGAALLFPGAGHWLQGRRRRAAIVAVILLGLFLGGTWLAQGSNLSRERHFYYWSGQFLLGAPALLTEALSGHPVVQSEIRFVDVGLLYACMAGLLNVLALLDVQGVAEKLWLGPVPARPFDFENRLTAHEPLPGSEGEAEPEARAEEEALRP